MRVSLIARLFFITTIVIVAQQTPLSMGLASGRTFCFSEDVPRHTLIKLDISSNERPVRLEIGYLRETLENITSSEKISKSITTQKFGVYRFCMTNLHQSYNTLTFELKSGVQAKDYASHEENKDYLASLDNQARIAELFMTQMRQESQAGLALMNQRSLNFNKYSVEYFFSAVFVGVVLLLSYVQYVVVRNHFISRKYI